MFAHRAMLKKHISRSNDNQRVNQSTPSTMSRAKKYIDLLRFRNYTILQGLQAIRCPAGLAFDIEKQTCNWKASVKNCEMKTRERKVKPLLFTDEPICQENYLACGDGNCIERGLFCNGEKDCNDGSDENACGEINQYMK